MWKTVALTALCAAWRVQDVEAMLAVLPLLELVEDAVGERTEALGATKWGKKPHYNWGNARLETRKNWCLQYQFSLNSDQEQ